MSDNVQKNSVRQRGRRCHLCAGAHRIPQEGNAAMASIYDREKAVAYAKRWALSRNQAYLDFQGLGGDCTNFVSQCLYAGCGVMNYTPVYGWYYISGNRRTASWTGVPYLYHFLTGNEKEGPYAREIAPDQARPGDVVQLGARGQPFTHTALIVDVQSGEIFVAAHTLDAWNRPLSSYPQVIRRFLGIEARG